MGRMVTKLLDTCEHGLVIEMINYISVDWFNGRSTTKAKNHATNQTRFLYNPILD